MKTQVCCLVVVGAAVLLSGCAGETLVDATGPRPTWVMTPLEPEDGVRFYVGMAVVRSVLEEREGRRRALANAAERAASSVAEEVRAQIREETGSEGAVASGEDRPFASIRDQVEVHSREIIRGILPKEYYYERWRIRPGLLAPSFERYKYHVLAAFPESEYERLVTGVAGAVRSKDP